MLSKHSIKSDIKDRFGSNKPTLFTGVNPPQYVSECWEKGAYCHTWISCLFFKAEGPLAL